MSAITWGIQKLVGQRQLGRRAAPLNESKV
jgi:hypothetical protein